MNTYKQMLRQWAVRSYKWAVVQSRRTDNRPVVYYLLFGCLFGLAFLCLIPPSQGADEPNHLLRAYQVSQGNFVADYIPNYQVNIGFVPPAKPRPNVGGTLPAPLVTFVAQAMGNVAGYTNTKYDQKQFRALKSILNTDKKMRVGFVNTAVYSPVAYVPSLPGILLGRLLHVRPIVLLYMARLSTLVIGLALIAGALYLMPFGKLPFAVIALLPMSVLQLSIVTADTMTLGMTFLAIAATLRYAFGGRDMRRQDIAILVAVFAVLGLTKPGMAFVSLLTLALLRNGQIPRRKVWITIGLVVFSAFVASFIWNALIKNLAIFGYQADYGLSYAHQFHFVVTQPLTYLRVLYEGFLTINFDGVPLSFIGNFGWQDAPLPLIFVIAGFALIALATFVSSQYESVKQGRLLRLVSVLAALAIAVMTATSIYLFTVPYRSPQFEHYMQGRYFIPVALLFVVACLGGKKQFSKAHYTSLARRCLYASAALLVVMTFVTVVRYYNIGETLNSLV